MPNRIKVPDADALLAENPDGIKLYVLDMQDETPLYRDIKLIAPCAGMLAEGRRTARLTWIIHEQRLRRGGVGWKLEQERPQLLVWVRTECANVLNLEYVKDTFGFTDGELSDLIEAERAKYEK